MDMIINGIPVDGQYAVASVREFNRIGQTVKPEQGFNADRVGFHIGMQCEELAETIAAVADGHVATFNRVALANFAQLLAHFGNQFKKGEHHGAVLRSDREAVLDGSIDVLVVTLGSLMYQTKGDKWIEAIGAVLAANAAKFPHGIAARDSNGKIMKPPGWTPPDLSPFVDQPAD